MKKIFCMFSAAVLSFALLSAAACTPGHQHTYKEEWTTNAEEHWHASDCGHEDEVSEKAAHSFSFVSLGGGRHKKTCSVCGYEVESEHRTSADSNKCLDCNFEYTGTDGLIYALNEDETAYTVTGIEEAKAAVTHIVVPNVYEGKPVTYVKEAAFKSNTRIKEVVLAPNIKALGESAFEDCSNIEKVQFPQNLESIGRAAFSGCRNFKILNLPENLTYIGVYAFQNSGYFNTSKNWDGNILYCGKYLLTTRNQNPYNVTVKEGTVLLAAYSFSDGDNPIWRKIELPQTLKYINDHAFTVSKLSEITIPKNVEVLGDRAFETCKELKKVTFESGSNLKYIGERVFRKCGALSQLIIPASVEKIGTSIDSHVSAEIFVENTVIPEGWHAEWQSSETSSFWLYSESQPAGDGNFWHYVDGAPVKW